MSPDTPTPCYGKWDLFDSTDPADHREAKALCDTCPTLAACQKLLDDLLRSHNSVAGPEGTWAGRHFVSQKCQQLAYSNDERRQVRVEAEAARYTETQAREAGSAYSRGERTEWVVVGNRVYSRRNKQAQRRARGAA